MGYARFSVRIKPNQTKPSRRLYNYTRQHLRYNTAPSHTFPSKTDWDLEIPDGFFRISLESPSHGRLWHGLPTTGRRHVSYTPREATACSLRSLASSAAFHAALLSPSRWNGRWAA
jgi:hypothetical protein